MTDTATIAETREIPDDIMQRAREVIRAQWELGYQRNQQTLLGLIARALLDERDRLTASLAAEREAREIAERERDSQREHIRKQAEDIMTLGRLVYDGSPSPVLWKDRAEAAEAAPARSEEPTDAR